VKIFDAQVTTYLQLSGNETYFPQILVRSFCFWRKWVYYRERDALILFDNKKDAQKACDVIMDPNRFNSK